MTDRKDMATTEWHPAEGVRLIGADEAQRALDAGQAAGRRREPGPRGAPPTAGRRRFSENEPRPTMGPDGAGPAPAEDDDVEIDLTDGYQQEQTRPHEPRLNRAMALTASPPAPPPPTERAPAGATARTRRLVSWGPPLPGDAADEAPAARTGRDAWTSPGAVRAGRAAEEHADTDAFAYLQPAPSADEPPVEDDGLVDDEDLLGNEALPDDEGLVEDESVGRRGSAPPEVRLKVTGGRALPHWTEPGDDGATGIGSSPGGREARPQVGSWARWRSDQGDWDDLDVGADLFPGGDEPKLGALDTDRSERSDLYSFDEAFRQLQEERSGSHPALSPDDPEEVPLIDDPAAGGTPERSRRTTSRRPLRSAGEQVPSVASSPSSGRPGRLQRVTDRLRRRHPADQTAGVDDGRGRDAGARRAGGRGATRAAHATPAPSVAGASSATQARRRRRGEASPRSDRSVLLSRILVGAALVALLIVAYAIGPKALVVLAAVVVLLCAAEAYSMLQRCGFRPATLLGLTATGGLMFAAYWRGEPALPLIAVLAFGATMVWYLLGISDARPLANVAVTTMTILWVGVLGSFAALLLRAPHGKGLFLGAVVVTVAADIVAYFGGRRWGRHALAPKVSPGKTVEGLAAGAAAAIIAGLVFGHWVTPWGGFYHGLLLGLAVAILAPIGDLFESLIKRDLEVKDSGTVLAGHGGLLDRFDSLLLVLPATYYLADYLHLVR